MPTYSLRLWLPDRPGALGAVASRIGAVRGDVVGIEVLERGERLAVDELVVELPHADLVDLMLDEVRQVDGVGVEEVRPVTGRRADPAVRALEAVAPVIAARDAGALWEALLAAARAMADPEWSCLLGTGCVLLAADGPAPAAAWLDAYRSGSQWRDAEGDAPQPLIVPLGGAPVSLVVGRSARPFHEAERAQLGQLGSIAAARLSQWELVRSLADHPAGARQPAGAREPGGTDADRPAAARSDRRPVLRPV